MPRTTLALTSFVSGEFSPKMDGRTDFDKYTSGAKTLENFLVHPQGAATRRVGTQHIAEVNLVILISECLRIKVKLLKMM